jgi:uncharacterized membrane protein
MKKFKVLFIRIWSNIRINVAGGLLIIIPVAITYAVGSFAFKFLDELFIPATTAITTTSGVGFTGMGVLIALGVVYMIGVIAKSSRTSRFLQPGLRVVEKIPLLGTIYVSAREATRLLSPNRSGRETRVVLLEFPRPGVRALGIVTAEIADGAGHPLLVIYVPTTPNPTSGQLAILPESEVTEAGVSVDQAMSVIVSGGILTPDVLGPERGLINTGLCPTCRVPVLVQHKYCSNCAAQLERPNDSSMLVN